MIRRAGFIRMIFAFGIHVVLIGFSFLCLGQTGETSFQSVRLPSTALLSATGGVNVSLADRDATFFSSNPALNSDSLNGWASASYLFYFADIGMANFSYQNKLGKLGSVSAGIQHLNLGSIQGYDQIGQPTGTYSSNETAVMIGKNHQVGNFRMGVGVKGIFSNVAGYWASALVFDVGGVFIHPTKAITAGLVFKNLGILLSDYSPTSSSRTPFDMQAGFTLKPAHMPVRFSFTAHHLIDYDIIYHDSTTSDESPSTLDKVLSHLNFGAEIFVHKNINALIGYNPLTHMELQLENTGGGSGLSFGLLAKVRNSELAVSRSGYVTGGAYQVSISSNIDKLINR